MTGFYMIPTIDLQWLKHTVVHQNFLKRYAKKEIQQLLILDFNNLFSSSPIVYYLEEWVQFFSRSLCNVTKKYLKVLREGGLRNISWSNDIFSTQSNIFLIKNKTYISYFFLTKNNKIAAQYKCASGALTP